MFYTNHKYKYGKQDTYYQHYHQYKDRTKKHNTDTQQKPHNKQYYRRFKANLCINKMLCSMRENLLKLLLWTQYINLYMHIHLQHTFYIRHNPIKQCNTCSNPSYYFGKKRCGYVEYAIM